MYPKDKYNEFCNVLVLKKRLIRSEKRCFVTCYDLDNKFLCTGPNLWSHYPIS